MVDVNNATSGGVLTYSSTPGPLAAVLPTMMNGVVNVCRSTEGDMAEVFHFDNKSVGAMGIYTDSTLFSIFTLPFVEGNARSAFLHVSSIVLTEKTARIFLETAKAVLAKR